MKNRKSSKGLKIVLVFTIIFLLAFIGSFVAFGFMATNVNDADIDQGFVAIFEYLFSDIQGLLTFKFYMPSNIIYLSLSGLLYFFAVLAVIYFIVGIVVCAKKKTGIVIPGMIASLFVVAVFYIMAAGLPKYFTILLKAAPYETDSSLVIPTIALLATGVIYIIFAYILYFVSIGASFKKAPEIIEEKTNDDVVVEEAPADEGPVMFEAVETEVTPENFVPVPEPEEEAQAEPEPAPVEEEKVEQPAPEVEPEMEPEREPERPVVEEKKADDREDLKSMLREIVRDIVRDEIARNNANQSRGETNPLGPVTGATFGGPLVVQYFNGGINSTTPAEPVKEVKPVPQQVIEPEPVKEQPAPQPAPVKEEPVVEPEPAPQPVEEEVEPEPVVEPEPAPQPVVVEEPVPAPVVEEKKPIIRIPFTERMKNADDEMKANYNELKNEILSYGVNSRVSNSGDTFRLHRKTYIKITIAGLSLKLYFALNPEDYKDTSLPVQDAGHKGIYADIPLVFKVKSGLSMRRCKQLIQDVFDKNGLEQGEIGQTDWVKELPDASNDD